MGTKTPLYKFLELGEEKGNVLCNLCELGEVIQNHHGKHAGEEESLPYRVWLGVVNLSPRMGNLSPRLEKVILPYKVFPFLLFLLGQVRETMNLPYTYCL